MEKKSCFFVILAYLYLALPNLIFFIGWCNLPTAIICSSALILGLYFTIKNSPKIWVPSTKKDIITVSLILLISVIWVLLSGIGGYMYQNGDHAIRNAMFELFLKKEWPVVFENNYAFLSYYTGFFLPAAAVGKFFKSADLGLFLQFIWAVTGVFTFFVMLTAHLKKRNLFPVILFIFFSGLDFIGMSIVYGAKFDYTPTAHLEWWFFHQYSSMTTQLFWVFNQAIPVWIAVALFLHEKNNKSLVFLYVCLLLNATLPAVGLLPFLIYFIIADGNDNLKEIFTLSHLKKSFIDSLSVQNLTSFFIMFPVLYFYLTSNFLKNYVHAGEYKIGTYFKEKIRPFTVITFWFLEAGIFLFCILKYNYKKILYWIIFIILLLLPYYKIGNGVDFEMRASIPVLVFLYLLIVKTLQETDILKNKVLSGILFVALFIGAITPFNEITRSLCFTKYGGENVIKASDLNQPYKHISFYGSTLRNVFYQYFAKKNN